MSKISCDEPSRTSVPTRRAFTTLKRVVMEALPETEDFARSFRGIERDTGLPREMVAAVCRVLAADGLAAFQKGLWTEDGEMAGAGYGLTPAGRKALRRPVKPETARHLKTDEAAS